MVSRSGPVGCGCRGSALGLTQGPAGVMSKSSRPHEQVFMTGQPGPARLVTDDMGSLFVGCTTCSMMLILADADGPARALRAGWIQSASGWKCPKHTPPPGGEQDAEPPPAEETRPAEPAAVLG